MTIAELKAAALAYRQAEQRHRTAVLNHATATAELNNAARALSEARQKYNEIASRDSVRDAIGRL